MSDESTSSTPAVAPTPTPTKTPITLIMKGGGVKGYAYLGAIEELRSTYEFNWYVGTSAGAIAAVLLGAGFTTDDLKKLLGEKNFRDFFDANCVRALVNYLFSGGLFKADALTSWLDDTLAAKLGNSELQNFPISNTASQSTRVVGINHR